MRALMMRLFAAVGLIALAGCGSAVSKDRGSGEVLTVVSGGVERELILQANPGDTPRPLVLIFHGGGGGAQVMARRTRAFADQLLTAGYAVAFMNGSSRRNGRNGRTWNGGHCCAYAMTAAIDEADFVDQAIDAIEAKLSLDKSRIFLMGHSNGGMSTYRLPAEMRTPVRGVVVISSAMFDDQPPLAPGLSAFLTHAKDDGNIAFDASFEPKQKRAWDAPPLPFREAEQRLARLLACEQPDRQSPTEGVIQRSRQCPKGAELTAIVSATGDHAWPKSISGFSLEDAILEFLDRQR